MNTISRSTLAKIDIPDFTPNPQVEHVKSMQPVIDSVIREQIVEIFGPDMMEHQHKVLAIIKTKRVLSEEAGKVRDAALNMGRSLLDLQAILDPTEFKVAREGSAILFPGFSPGNVHKLMAVAKGWDEGVFPTELASQHYTILYEFTTVVGGVERAVQEDVFRPDVTREEVKEWKRRVKSQRYALPPRARQGAAINLRSLASERERLIEQRRSLTEQVQIIDTRLREIALVVGGEDDPERRQNDV